MLSHAQIAQISHSLTAALKHSALVIGFSLNQPTSTVSPTVSYQLTASLRREIEKTFALALDD